ncbi:MAG: hypothetical protein AAB911_00525 [Patescibacteria group bacterium]
MVTRDTGPWLALEKIGKAFYEQGILFSMPFTFKLYNADPPGISVDQVSKLVTDEGMGFDVVVCGMSSSPELAKEELAACEAAVKAGIPLCLFADTFRSWARPWFEPYRQAASALFVINPEEAEKARNLFPHAKIVASGNPAWEDFFFPKYTREEVRQKLEITDEQKMILVPGGKCLAQNMLLFGAVIEAANQPGSGYRVVLTLHPGDSNPSEIYADLVKYSRTLVLVIPKEMLSGSEIIPGCDVVVQSGSTIGIEAACQRKPVIEYLTYVGLGNWERQTGSRKMETIELGIAGELRAFHGIHELSLYIHQLTGAEHIARLGSLAQQEKVFPQPAEKGVAVKMIINTLQELCQ